MSLRIECQDLKNRARAISVATSAARRGAIVVMPTESVYAYVTDAFSQRGTKSLRDIKGLDASVPLSVFVSSSTTVSGIAARISPEAHKLMDAFWPGELTLLLEPGSTLTWDHPVSAPLAVRMPIHPVALAVLKATGPLASTGVTLPGVTLAGEGSTLATTVTGAAGLERLDSALIEVVLDAGDLVASPLDVSVSTVVDCTVSPPRVVRQGVVDLVTLQSVVAGIE